LKFADCKDRVIELIRKEITVSVETMNIISEMGKAKEMITVVMG